ncbi:MAG: oligopeptide/dipeptide ABC transporter ATP-binding protein [Acidimicrobiia bacterium]
MTLTNTGAATTETRPPAAIASVDGLKVHFESKRGIVYAVDGVSFDILDGETVGLVGETGCGKTVTARSFLRLVPMPPGIQVGGSIFFRPRRPCDQCDGSGCEHCDQSGRLPATCPHCNGEGCGNCDGTGIESIDLLTISESRMREIRGDRIAMIFQDPGKALNPALTVRDQIAEVLYHHRSGDLLEASGIGAEESGLEMALLRRRATQRDRRLERLLMSLPPIRSRRDRLTRATDTMIAASLAETQIPNPAKIMQRYPHELSGGMKQRVMIAQALACDPDLLIADEPTTALDVTVQARILELVKGLQERHRTAVLYISHDLSVVRQVSDRVAVMYAGRIVEVGLTGDIFRQPLHPYTQGLLTAVPSRVHERGRLTAIEGTVPELVEPPPSCRFTGRCPYEAEVCGSSDPDLRTAAERHTVACFIYHPPPSSGHRRPSFAERTR